MIIITKQKLSIDVLVKFPPEDPRFFLFLWGGQERYGLGRGEQRTGLITMIILVRRGIIFAVFHEGDDPLYQQG
ncbi:MAG: hypothetical protein DRJ06_06160 [Candidatus Aminicenantes bacterium]|nr:MAG: hypothetical protein DRJ06_06160 [Candidatus Aminicenantes bacterium]